MSKKTTARTRACSGSGKYASLEEAKIDRFQLSEPHHPSTSVRVEATYDLPRHLREANGPRPRRRLAIVAVCLWRVREPALGHEMIRVEEI